ncbi:WD40 repeat-like protein [Byssothecium circinans]|uniref:Mitochondrial division protein 1 n=1 Tax=Byssothecium circinans TaxID=147558 RepID=A0A6A5TUN2_9PLEO|nr:WD40 repeat-like protein [Byssothecium circinans]
MIAPVTYLPSLNEPNSAHTAPILALRVSANYVVSSSADRSVRIWSKSNGGLALPPLHGESKAAVVKSIEISEGLGLVFGGDSKGNIVAWRLSDGGLAFTQPAHGDFVLALAMDKTTLASASRDHDVKVWEVEISGTGRYSLQPRHILQGHTMPVLAVQLLEHFIYTASGDKSIRIWNRDSGRLVQTLELHASVAQFQVRKSAAGTQLAGACTDGMVRLYDVDKGDELACLKGHTGVVRSLQFTEARGPNSFFGHAWIASASYDGTIRVWARQQEGSLSWECLYNFSFSDAVVAPLPLFDEMITVNYPGQERERLYGVLLPLSTKLPLVSTLSNRPNPHLYLGSSPCQRHDHVRPLTSIADILPRRAVLLTDPAPSTAVTPASVAYTPPKPVHLDYG